MFFFLSFQKKKKIANPTTPVKTEAISIQGHLFKLGDGLYPQWNLRFFVYFDNSCIKGESKL